MEADTKKAKTKIAVAVGAVAKNGLHGRCVADLARPGNRLRKICE
jgi:hypothetical protein